MQGTTVTANVTKMRMCEFIREDSAEECFQLTAALCQHRPKQNASHCWGSTRSSILKNFFLLLREILLDGTNCMIVTANSTSTVLNTKLTNSPVVLSWYVGNSTWNINHLLCQMILNESSCVPAILLHVQKCTWRKGKHSWCCDHTHQYIHTYIHTYIHLII